ncbi:MAG: DUF692 domain-containing protein [Bdellovibrionales bacterium]|nr:DUF692 domain-containing protein [Bdellovibrionales bacterium]
MKAGAAPPKAGAIVVPSKFVDLGVGVGLRPDFYDQFRTKAPHGITWVEVISENYMDWRAQELSQAQRQLQQVRNHVPVALHGVSLSIGSSDPVNKAYLKSLKGLVEKIEPCVVSDHLCWTGVGGQNLHDLLPLPYTEEAIRLVTQKLDLVQNYLGREILIENVSSYLEFHHSEMTEWEFLGEVLKRSGCGLLLDINNVYVSSVNHSFDPKTYIRSLPIDRIGQIHLAGHSNEGAFLIDTHDQPVCQEVWDLYSWALKMIGKRSTMIERDGNIPEWKIMEQELMHIHSLRREVDAEHSSQTATANI